MKITIWTDNDRKDKLVYLNGLTFIREFYGLKVLDTTYGLAQNVGLSHMEWRIKEHTLDRN